METTEHIEHRGNGHSASRVDRVKEFVYPKVRDAREYLVTHRIVTALVGFGLGFFVGRLMRRS